MTGIDELNLNLNHFLSEEGTCGSLNITRKKGVEVCVVGGCDGESFRDWISYPEEDNRPAWRANANGNSPAFIRTCLIKIAPHD